MWYYKIDKKLDDLPNIKNNYPNCFFIVAGNQLVVTPTPTYVEDKSYTVQDVDSGKFYFKPVLTADDILANKMESDSKITFELNGKKWDIIPFAKPFKKFVFNLTPKKMPNRNDELWTIYGNLINQIEYLMSANKTFHVTDDIGSSLVSAAIVNSYRITPELINMLEIGPQEVEAIFWAALGVNIFEEESLKKK